MRSPEERLFEKVEKEGHGGCWLFVSTSERRGYGVLWYEGRVQYAHRVSWMLAGREIPPGMIVDHICRTPKCVNPDHLRLVTTRQSALENCDSPSARNAQKRFCKAGHEYTPENTAVYVRVSGKTRHGKPRTKPAHIRICLTCQPAYWKHALIPRERPAPRQRNPKGKE